MAACPLCRWHGSRVKVNGVVKIGMSPSSFCQKSQLTSLTLVFISLKGTFPRDEFTCCNGVEIQNKTNKTWSFFSVFPYKRGAPRWSVFSLRGRLESRSWSAGEQCCPLGGRLVIPGDLSGLSKLQGEGQGVTRLSWSEVGDAAGTLTEHNCS